MPRYQPCMALSLLVRLIVCNVEKVIFIAPDATLLPADASFDNLLLTSLNHEHLSVRTHLEASFPTTNSTRGTESWLLLEGLKPSQRYEVRVCWLATQPTSFWLYTHSIATAFETPSLISSLSSYAYARHSSLTKDQITALQSRRLQSDERTPKSSILFLQIYAAADYFTLNTTLMNNVPPVLVDIILDPYIFNVFPQSLLPTAIYITIIAIAAWFLAKYIAEKLWQLSIGTPEIQQALPGRVDNKKRQ